MVSLDTDSPLVVYLEAHGDRTITQIKSWSTTSDYVRSTDDFDFVAVDEDPTALRDLEGQPVKLTVSGVPQVFGRIDYTVRGDDGLAVACNGRDYIADLVECNVDPTLVFKEGETLGSAILKACGPIGITRIDTDGDAHAAIDKRLGVPGKTKKSRGASRADGATMEDLKPDMGQGIYEFLKPICDRYQCTIQPSVSRNALLIAGPHYEQDPAYAIVRSRSGASAVNNVVSASAHRDYSSFPTITIVQGHGSPRTGEPTASASQTIDTWAEAQHFGGELARTLDSITWTGRRKPGTTEGLPIDKIYRLNVFRDDKARNHTQLTAVAKHLFCQNLKKTLEYRVKLKGHVDPYSGAIWSVNTIVRVADEICDINEDLWIQSRKLSFSPDTGAMTELVCIRPDTFDFQPGVSVPFRKAAKKSPAAAPVEPTPRRGG